MSNKHQGGKQGQGKPSHNAAQQNPFVINSQSLSCYQPFDLPTELELDLWQSWKEWSVHAEKTSMQSERVNLLQRVVSQSDDMHKKMVRGMIFGILAGPNQTQTRPQNSPNILPCEVILQDLMSVVRDNFDFATHILFSLVMQNFDVFKQQTLERVLWLTETLMTKSVPVLKELVLCLIQSISASSGANQRQLFLNKALVEILLRHVDWVCAQPDKFPAIVFIKFLRQAEEHFNKGEAEKLLEIELNLCRYIWQARQVQCIEAGRELIRIFSNHSKRPELAMIKEELSKSIQGKPLINHLLEKRGNKQGEPNVFVKFLLNFEVQRRLEFMLSRLPEVNIQWHLKWLLNFAGIEFGKESESLLVDIVRYIVVNVTPTNEIIHSTTLQRYTLIGHLISQQKHHLHQSYVLQALFIDWLYYDERQADAIMLVEPGMLLIYRSADKHPRLTDMLVEYLYDYASIYDPNRVDEAFQSIQKVFIDCEAKGVVQSIKSHLINHSKLQQHTQVKLKKMYAARRNPRSGADEPSGVNLSVDSNVANMSLLANQQHKTPAEDYDMIMTNDMDISGQFSPPHEPEEPQGFASGDKLSQSVVADIDSPYAADDPTMGDSKKAVDAMLVGQQEASPYDFRETQTKDDLLSKPIGGDKSRDAAYNIDLFSGQEDEGKNSDQVMSDDLKNKVSKSDSCRESNSSSSNSHSGSQSSDEDDNEDSEMQDEGVGKSTTIEVPVSVIQRFFSKREVVDEFLLKINQASTFALLDLCVGVKDLCATYNFNESQAEELTELSYILYESFKDSLVQTDLVRLLPKWKTLSFVHLLSYLEKVHQANNMAAFVIIAYLIRSLAQFDAMFEVKLATHCLVQSSTQPSLGTSCKQMLINYANLFYSVGGVSATPSQPTDQQSSVQQQLSLLPLQRLLNESVLNRLVQSCQLKFLNYFMVAVVQDLIGAYATENDHYLNTFVTYCSPQSLQKLATSIKIGQVRLFDNGLSAMFTKRSQRNSVQKDITQDTVLPMSYLSQQALWTLLTASLEQTDSPLLKSQRQIDQLLTFSCPIEALCNLIVDQISTLAINGKTTAQQMQSILSATFLGLQQFTSTYNSLVRQLHGGQAGFDRLSKGFQAMLELYQTLDQMTLSDKIAKTNKNSLKQMIKLVQRDVAQTILVCFFSQTWDKAADEHQHLLAMLVKECENVRSSDMSQTVKSRTLNRLKAAKDIFRSKLSQKIVESSNLRQQVSAISNYAAQAAIQQTD